MYGCRSACEYDEFSSTITNTCLGVGAGLGDADWRAEAAGLEAGVDWATGWHAVVSSRATSDASATRAIPIVAMVQILPERT